MAMSLVCNPLNPARGSACCRRASAKASSLIGRDKMVNE